MKLSNPDKVTLVGVAITLIIAGVVYFVGVGPTYAQGSVPPKEVEPYLKPKATVIPDAAAARAEAQAVTRIKIANEIPLLISLVSEEIQSTMNQGYTMCNPEVDKYHLETIHIVAVRLRAKGYRVELVNGIMGGELLVIDWEKK